jgi:hypothetical protein
LEGDGGEPGTRKDRADLVGIGQRERPGRIQRSRRERPPGGQGLVEFDRPEVVGLGLPGQQGQAATGAKRPGDVGEGGHRVAEVHRAGAADGQVEGLRLERMDLGVGLEEGGVGDALLGRPLAGPLKHA